MVLIPPRSGLASGDVPAPRRSRWAPWTVCARLLLGLLLVTLSVLLIAWLTFHWAILPHIDHWRGEIEQRASQALGVPVRIGQIEVRSGGWVPAVELHDVRLLDAQQRTALVLPRVVAAVSPRTLLAMELRFRQLLIDGAQLDARRDARGRISVAGLALGGESAGDAHGAADWFFKQSEFVIRGGSLRWTDEQRSAPPLVLSDVQFVLRNGLLRHDLRLDATPPPEWGERFTIAGRFTQRPLARAGDWRHWSGHAYASLPRADVRELGRHVTLPFELSQGEGALRGWFDLNDGRPSAATLDVALRAVSLRLAADTEAMAFEQVEGRLSAQRDAQGTQISVSHFGFLTGDDVRWPPGDMSLAWQQREGQPATGGSFTAERLDLGLMARVASRIPMGSAMRKLLADLSPPDAATAAPGEQGAVQGARGSNLQGVATFLTARWDGPLDAPAHYRLKSLLNGVTIPARPADDPHAVGRPGLRNASVQIDANETGGDANLAVADGAIDLPGVFDEPVLPLDQLAAQINWKIVPLAGVAPGITVRVRDALISNPDAQVRLNATWSTGDGGGAGHLGHAERYPGRLEMEGTLSNGVASRTSRYLPLGIPQGTRHYVEHAVLGGTIKNASFRVKGDLADFPFYNSRTAKGSEFRIAAQVADVGFAYVPSEPASGAEPAWVSPWPALAQVDGELIIDRNSLEIRNAQALLGGATWSRVQGGIRSLSEHSVLTLDAAGRGPLAEMLHYVDVTPIGGWIGKALAQTSAAGVADIKLGLEIPLTQVSATAARGSVVLGGNELRITPDSPLLAGAKGRVDFSDKGFAVVGATAKVYGGDASFEGGSQPDGSVRLTGQGTAAADALRRAPELGAIARVGNALSGQAAYRMSLGFVHGRPELTVTSNLVGIASKLPAPLAKPAEAPLALRYQTTLAPESLLAGVVPRDTLRVELGAVVQAQFQRELVGDTPRVLRGGIGVMEAAPQPANGVAANVTLAALDVDEWQAGADKWFGAAGGVGGGAGAGADPADASGYLPSTMALRVQELRAGSRRLNKLVAGVSREAGIWRANVDAEQLNGYVEYRSPLLPGAAGGVYARLSRLSLPKTDADQVESLLDEQPASVPALDLVVEDFELRGKRLGRVEVEAVNRVTGEGRNALREWRLSKFKLSLPEAQFSGTGSWGATGKGGGPRRSVLNFELALVDSGALLERLGMGKSIKGGKGQLSGQVSWQGSPLALDYASLAGQLKLGLDAGQFLKADPGVARLLGGLSLQSLPRRLTLDFRDVFQEGFAFDSVTGDVSISQGVAQTRNLRTRGVQAVVLTEGSADLERETQDLRVVVVPEINAGTASLAYAVINPVIGLGTFVAQALLRKPLAEAGTREFHVSGPWADPKVESVAYKASEAELGELGLPQVKPAQ